MKRLLCFVTAILMIPALAGCKRDRGGASSDDVSEEPRSNIESYAVHGRMDCISELKLGVSPEAVAAYYGTTLEEPDTDPARPPASSSAASETNPDETPYEYEVPKLMKYGEGIVRLQSEDLLFCYNEEDKESGILMMVSFTDVYLLTMDAATPELTRAMVGTPRRSGTGDDNLWFFLPQGKPEYAFYMEYVYGKYRAVFYFENDLLIAVSLCEYAKWDAVHPVTPDDEVSSAPADETVSSESASSDSATDSSFAS